MKAGGRYLLLDLVLDQKLTWYWTSLPNTMLATGDWVMDKQELDFLTTLTPEHIRRIFDLVAFSSRGCEKSFLIMSEGLFSSPPLAICGLDGIPGLPTRGVLCL